MDILVAITPSRSFLCCCEDSSRGDPFGEIGLVNCSIPNTRIAFTFSERYIHVPTQTKKTKVGSRSDGDGFNPIQYTTVSDFVAVNRPIEMR